MTYIRFGKHYLHTAYLALGSAEFALFAISPLIFQLTLAKLLGLDASMPGLLHLTVFACIMSLGTLSMGLYTTLLKDGFSAMFYRSLVSYCFLGLIGLIFLYVLIPSVSLLGPNGKLAWIILIAMVQLMALRWLFVHIVSQRHFAKKALIYGSGQFAHSIGKLLESDGENVDYRIEHYVCDGHNQIIADDQLIDMPECWWRYAMDNDIATIVIAPEDRRQQSPQLMQEFMECKLRGIEVTSAIDFLERATKKAHLPLVHPSWILFSEGFKPSRPRDFSKRAIDLAISLTLAVIMAPFMLLTAIAIAIETGRPILYSQERVGELGKTFRIYKFRSMRQDAEKGGKAIWAKQNDDRITKVGAFIRNTRLDELPQLWNVIKGEMSIVGPRPERPEFVEKLKEQIPFYDTRHYVKPGLMGWAQLNYPYGASVEDARGKLEYDLYYSKNHSMLLDLLIMVQTVEVVLLGKGVR